MTTRIIVTVRGGLVQDIYTNLKYNEVKADVLDYDNMKEELCPAYQKQYEKLDEELSTLMSHPF